MLSHDIKPGDRVIWLRSPGRSFLTGRRVKKIPGIVVRVCPQRIKIRVVVDSRDKMVNVDPDNLISYREIQSWQDTDANLLG